MNGNYKPYEWLGILHNRLLKIAIFCHQDCHSGSVFSSKLSSSFKIVICSVLNLKVFISSKIKTPQTS